MKFTNKGKTAKGAFFTFLLQLLWALVSLAFIVGVTFYALLALITGILFR